MLLDRTISSLCNLARRSASGHLLAFAMVHNGLYSAGRYVLLAPTLNRAVQEAVAKYRSHLLSGGIIPFDFISFEQLIEAIRRSGAADIAALLHERYLDLNRPGLIGGSNS